MYTTKNYKSKKELKEAVAKGEVVTYFQAGPFGGNEPRDGVFCCEGPWFPEPHRWYATVTAKNGRIIKIK